MYSIIGYNDFNELAEKRLFVIAGPCVVEGREMAFNIAKKVKETCEALQIPLIFKASYRKANRSSVASFTGIGDKKALQILDSVRKEFGIPVTTDIHAVEEADMAAEFVDVLQIPAFLCRQTDLLIAAAKTGKLVNVKKGQFLSADSMRFVVEKIKRYGNHKVLLTERGTTFGYQDLVVDFRSIPIMQSFDVPIVLDCTHSLQRPNLASGVTGGTPSLISTIACAGVAAGIDGLFIETHHDPANAKSDGENMLPLNQLPSLLERVLRIRDAIMP
jgi:2-dehydro-3-deoxyphosphooctonate aldolase (KDO 8-P synthase)